jgi:hypothetical protein
MLHVCESARQRRLITKDEGHEDHEAFSVLSRNLFVFFAFFEPS